MNVTRAARNDLAEYIRLFGVHSLTPEYVRTLFDDIDRVAASAEPFVQEPLRPLSAEILDEYHRWMAQDALTQQLLRQEDPQLGRMLGADETKWGQMTQVERDAYVARNSVEIKPIDPTLNEALPANWRELSNEQVHGWLAENGASMPDDALTAMRLREADDEKPTTMSEEDVAAFEALKKADEEAQRIRELRKTHLCADPDCDICPPLEPTRHQRKRTIEDVIAELPKLWKRKS